MKSWSVNIHKERDNPILKTILKSIENLKYKFLGKEIHLESKHILQEHDKFRQRQAPHRQQII